MKNEEPAQEPPARSASAAAFMPHKRFKPKACCGSAGPRHKKGCSEAGERRSEPEDEKRGVEEPAAAAVDSVGDKVWRCINCDTEQAGGDEQPEECKTCPGTVFVEKQPWE